MRVIIIIARWLISYPVRVAATPIFLFLLIKDAIKCKGNLGDFFEFAKESTDIVYSACELLLVILTFGLWDMNTTKQRDPLTVPIEVYKKELEQALKDEDFEIASILRDIIALKTEIIELEKLNNATEKRI